MFSAVDQLRDRIIEHGIEVAMRAADITVQRTQDAASRRTGALVEGISHTQPEFDGQRVGCDIISAADYSSFEDDGTGIYGPLGVRIFPKTAKALRFDWPAAGGIVFAKSVAGSPGKHYFKIPMKPDTIQTVLGDILAACVAAYSDPGAPSPPSQHYISHGGPGFLAKGDQLIVWSGGISATHPFPLTQLTAVKKVVVPSALISIQVMRDCWPTGNVTNVNATTPSPGEFSAAAEASALDAATIFGYIAQHATIGDLLPSLPTISTAQDIAFTPMVPVGPLGTRIGWRWPFAVKLSVP